MKRRLRVESRAEEEILEAAQWYQDREQGLGSAFVAAFRRALTRIVAAPESFAEIVDVPLEPKPRSAPMKPYPYRSCSGVGSEIVRVIAVLHERRDRSTLG